MGEGVGEMETGQDFQNQQVGHGLEGTWFLVLFQGPESLEPLLCVGGDACRHEPTGCQAPVLSRTRFQGFPRWAPGTDSVGGCWNPSGGLSSFLLCSWTKGQMPDENGKVWLP